MDGPGSRLIEVSEIFPQRFGRGLANVEETGVIHLSVFALSKLMEQLLYEVLVVGDRES